MEEEKQMQEEEENCQRGDGDDQVVEENFEKSTVDATNADQKGDFSNASDFISESPSRPVSPGTLIKTEEVLPVSPNSTKSFKGPSENAVAQVISPSKPMNFPTVKKTYTNKRLPKKVTSEKGTKKTDKPSKSSTLVSPEVSFLLEKKTDRKLVFFYLLLILPTNSF